MRPIVEGRQIILALILACGTVYLQALIYLFADPVFQEVAQPFGLVVFAIAAIFCVWLCASDPKAQPLPIPIGSGKPQSGRVATPDPGTIYCSRCTSYFNEQCLHCRYCDRCVFRLDHHCFYANNCVGKENYRVFLASIGSLWLLSGFYCATEAAIALQSYSRIPTWNLALMLVAGLIMISIFLFTSYLAILHVELARRNMTTIQYSQYLVDREARAKNPAAALEARQRESAISFLAERLWCWRPQKDQKGKPKDHRRVHPASSREMV
ncbi:DHHC palmitoyltransferase-domain-containing protein [Blastocladiella britannica]|nr:DHHC palmitoyltransferase-domain-containing protein [Blastocladiella britannica]